jgi:hypothetical protein
MVQVKSGGNSAVKTGDALKSFVLEQAVLLGR